MKPTPVINFIAWVYLLLGMENFFWAAFRFIYEGIHGQWLRFGLNITLAIAFIVFSMRLSRQKNPGPEEMYEPRRTPVKTAWGLSCLCFALQYYRFIIWAKGHVIAPPNDNIFSVLNIMVLMHDSWISLMAAFVLAQEYRHWSGPQAVTTPILNWEVTAGNYRATSWFKRSVYLDLNSDRLKIRANLFWMRMVPVKDIIEVKDVAMRFYPRLGLAVRYKEGSRERQLNFISTDYRAWITAFEGLNIKVNDASGLREKQFPIYRWWRFYTVVKAFTRSFIFLTIFMTVLMSILGNFIYKVHPEFESERGAWQRGNLAGPAYKILTQDNAAEWGIESFLNESDKIVLTVRENLSRSDWSLPAYFNHLFRDNKIILYKNMDYTDIRFKGTDQLEEYPLLKKAGFLYSYPVTETTNGAVRYNFIYIEKMEGVWTYLRSIEVVRFQGYESLSWSSFKFCKIAKGF